MRNTLFKKISHHRRFIIATLAFCALGLQQATMASAQKAVPDSTTAETEEKNSNATDYTANWSKEAKTIGFSVGSDIGKITYLKIAMSLGYGDANNMDYILGIGVQKRYIIMDDFLVQGILYPYVGYGQYDYKVESGTNKNGSTKMETKTKRQVSYGAAGNISAGIRLFTSKKNGNRTFLTVGYYVGAPEFKTKKMFKNGSWGLGITIM